MQTPAPDSFNWPDRPSSSDSAPEVKLEQASDSKAFYVPSSSTASFASKPASTTAATPPIRRHSSTGSQLRRSKHPYSPPPHDTRIRSKYGGEAAKMSSHNYSQQWGKSDIEAGRQQAYAFSASGNQLSMRRQTTFGEDGRPQSSGSSITSSSLRGAMGEIQLSSNSEGSNSPSSASDVSQQRQQESYNVASGMVWSQTNADVAGPPAMPAGSFDDHSNPLSFQNISSPSGSLTSNSPSTSYLQYPGYNHSNYANPNVSPPVFPTTGYSESFNAYPQTRATTTPAPPLIIPQLAHLPSGRGPMSITPTTAVPAGNRSHRSTDDELRNLRNKVRELELINESARLRIRELENELANPASGPLYPPSSISGLPAPAPQLPTSPSFAASWKARTDARIKLFCSLNRAGNALCAWHDSRRERRAHPPGWLPPATSIAAVRLRRPSSKRAFPDMT
ncbi:hypothetical protein BC827DRAFT_483597 [Russula dissimulans]|nr:hypothetical protein BC827DRAFT_483597 [Russula dissimulans]